MLVVKSEIQHNKIEIKIKLTTRKLNETCVRGAQKCCLGITINIRGYDLDLERIIKFWQEQDPILF